MYENQLTNKQLIELLQKYPSDALIWHEGCDCLGAAKEVDYNNKDNTIIITRF